VLELDGLTRRFGDVVALDDLVRVRRPERRRQDHRDADRARRAQPDAGEVRWNGGAVDAPTRARFGYMPEERGLYLRMRVRDQLVYLGRLCGRPGRELAHTIDRWLERLGLDPDGGWAQIVSFFPGTAPFAMPGRIALGAIEWWEPVLAAVLTGAAIAGLVVLAGRVYTGAILHTGTRLTLRDAWRRTALGPS
jgi:hypothetical protein